MNFAPARKTQLRAEILLFVATALWGGAYLVTRDAVRSISPFVFVGVRFCVASAMITLLTRPDLPSFTRREMRGGFYVALAMVGGYTSQAFAMTSMGAGRTAFINALYVPMVPVLLIILGKPGHRPWPHWLAWVAVGVSCVGLYLMAGPGGGGFGRGEALAFGGAGAIAAEILLVAKFAPGQDARRLAVAQCVSVAVLCLVLAWLRGDPVFVGGWIVPAAALGCMSAFLQVSVNWAMRAVPAGRATLIYATEPVWAGALGVLTGERMSGRAIVGAGLILVSLVMPRNLPPK